MYVITFYSFKGGVGRTMALVNVAAELVRRGRKVLVVDFDLEAPGLETYKRLRPKKPHPGIVEYVTEFRHTRQVPDLLDYIYETKPIGKMGGRLWVMPAGQRDRAAYRSDLARLDWQRLYRDEDGFLLFEDTKKGWEEELKPDYVLIDSRTGDTDVLGICTRQMPDSVVLMFTPNEQNLAGLENVCRDIRREATEGLKKTIRLHFVAANVPDLDDEKRILHRQLTAFRDRLGIPERPEKIRTIRRYESDLLFNQAVFVLDKPRSRLAREYKRLVRALIVNNQADRDGALLFLRQYGQRYIPRVARNEDETDAFGIKRSRANLAVRGIIGHFLHDPGMLVAVAECKRLAGATEWALSLLNWALKMQPGLAQALFDRAMCKTSMGDAPGAAEDLLRYLQTPGLDTPQVFRALAELGRVAPDRLVEGVRHVDIEALDLQAQWEMATLLAETDPGLAPAIEIMKKCLAKRQKPFELQLYNGAEYELSTRLIRARRWNEAIQVLKTENTNSQPLVAMVNRAMACWGVTGDLPEELCRYIREGEAGAGPNDGYLVVPPDAKAIVLWRLGMQAEALSVLEQGAEFAGKSPEPLFSYWRYREVSPDQFLEDCEKLRRMFRGEPLRPEFLGPVAPTTPA